MKRFIGFGAAAVVLAAVCVLTGCLSMMPVAAAGSSLDGRVYKNREGEKRLVIAFKPDMLVDVERQGNNPNKNIDYTINGNIITIPMSAGGSVKGVYELSPDGRKLVPVEGECSGVYKQTLILQ